MPTEQLWSPVPTCEGSPPPSPLGHLLSIQTLSACRLQAQCRLSPAVLTNPLWFGGPLTASPVPLLAQLPELKGTFYLLDSWLFIKRPNSRTSVRYAEEMQKTRCKEKVWSFPVLSRCVPPTKPLRVDPPRNPLKPVLLGFYEGFTT